MAFLQPALLSGVCIHLSTTDLKAVALAHSQFCVEAQRILFQAVAVHSPTLRVAQDFAEKRHLTKSVQTFKVAINPSSDHPPSIYQILAKAISHMADLVSLSVSIPGCQASAILPQNSQFQRMRSFKATLAIDSNVVRFLHTAPQLVTIHLYNLDQTQEVEGNLALLDLVPQLPSCRGFLTSGWPHATSIFLTACDLTTEDVRDFSEASGTAGVTTLDAEISSPFIPALQRICSELPSLERMRVRTTYDFWHDMSSTSRNLESIQETLRSPTSLKSAEICRTHWRRCPKADTMVSNITPPHLWLPVPGTPGGMDSGGCGFGMGCTDYYLFSDD